MLSAVCTLQKTETSPHCPQMWLCIVSVGSYNTVHYRGAVPPSLPPLIPPSLAVAESDVSPPVSGNGTVQGRRQTLRSSTTEQCDVLAVKPNQDWEERLGNIARSSRRPVCGPPTASALHILLVTQRLPTSPQTALYCIEPSDCGLGAC